ncbi:MAG TPA: nucleotidyltransferase domain-containing protein [Candidatus Hydrogenedentes bacterium]|nr:nucleotidyltransferase domain-containing protein [Candidatus Hydrogenedentota bacterium]
MGIEQTIIDEIVRRITAAVPVEQIILFGSAAAGQMSRDSDIDLLILKNSVANRREDWLLVQDTLQDMGYPFDIIIMARERFEETKDVIGGIAYPASKHGRVIYEAA